MRNTLTCIYHVEDNPADRNLVAFGLNSHGVYVDIRTAMDGEQAMELLRKAASGDGCLPSIVIVDINLPKISGLEVVRRMRTIPGLSTVPTVVLTSSDDPGDRERCLALDIRAYLQKPMDLPGYVALGESLLKLASLRD